MACITKVFTENNEESKLFLELKKEFGEDSAFEMYDKIINNREEWKELNDQMEPTLEDANRIFNLEIKPSDFKVTYKQDSLVPIYLSKANALSKSQLSKRIIEKMVTENKTFAATIRSLLFEAHPDKGGNAEYFSQLKEIIDSGKGDLQSSLSLQNLLDNSSNTILVERVDNKIKDVKKDIEFYSNQNEEWKKEFGENNQSILNNIEVSKNELKDLVEVEGSPTLNEIFKYASNNLVSVEESFKHFMSKEYSSVKADNFDFKTLVAVLSSSSTSFDELYPILIKNKSLSKEQLELLKTIKERVKDLKIALSLKNNSKIKDNPKLRGLAAEVSLYAALDNETDVDFLITGVAMYKEFLQDLMNDTSLTDSQKIDEVLSIISHEFLHIATLSELDNKNSNLSKFIGEEFEKLKSKYKTSQFYNSLSEKDRFELDYTLSSEEEFAASLFNSNVLKSYIDNRTGFAKFIQAILKFLGINKSNYAKLLNNFNSYLQNATIAKDTYKGKLGDIMGYQKYVKQEVKLDPSNEFYTDLTNKFVRTTTFIDEYLAGKTKKVEDIEGYFDDKAMELYPDKYNTSKRNDPGFKIRYKGKMLTFQEYKEAYESSKNKMALGVGTYAHKMLEGAVTKTDVQAELAKIKSEYSLSDDDLKFINDERISQVITLLGIADYPVDKIISEKVLSILSAKTDSRGMNGVAGTTDLIVQRGKDLYSIHDLKTGAIEGKTFGKFKYGNFDYDTFNKYSVQMALYMLMFKYENPNAKFTDATIVQMDKLKGENVVQKSIDFTPALKVLEEYFKQNDEAFHSVLSRLGLFDVQNYWSADSELENKAKNTEQLFRKQNKNITKGETWEVVKDQLFREYSKVSNELAKTVAEKGDNNEQYITLKERSKELMRKIIKHTTGKDTMSTETHEGISYLAATFGFLQGQDNEIIKSVETLMQRSTANYNKEIAKIKREFDTLNEQLAAESPKYFTGKGYESRYGFMYNSFGDLCTYKNTLANSSDYKDDSWNKLSPIQRKWLDHYRWSIRFEMFYTMDPNKGLEHINQELRERTNWSGLKGSEQLDKEYLMEQAKKLEERASLFGKGYNAFIGINRGNFTYWEGWTPRVIKTEEETKNISEFIDYNLKALEADEQTQMDILDKSDSTRATGLSLKYLGSKESREHHLSGIYTMNGEITYKFFMASLLRKRHFEDTFTVATSYAQWLKEIEEKKGTTEHENLIYFLKRQMAAIVTQQKVDDFKGRTISVNGRNYSWDLMLRSMTNVMGRTALAYKILPAIRTGIEATSLIFGETATGIWNATLGKVSKKLRFEEKDFTIKKVMKSIGRLTSNSEYRSKVAKISENIGFIPDSTLIEGNTDKKQIKTKQGRLIPYLQVMGYNIDPAYGLYSIFDNIDFTILLTAMMEHTMVKMPDGSEKALIDLYDKDGNYFGPVRGIDSITNKPITELTPEEIGKMKEVSKRIMGAYRPEERMAIEVGTFGYIIARFKKAVMPQIWRMFDKKYSNKTLGEFINTNVYVVNDIAHPDFQKEYTVGTPEYEEQMKKGTFMLPKVKWEERIEEGYVWTLANSFTNALLSIRFPVWNTATGSKKGDRFATKSSEEARNYFKNLSNQQKKNLAIATSHVMLFTIFYTITKSVFGDADEEDKNKIKKFFTTITYNSISELNLLSHYETITSFGPLERFINLNTALFKKFIFDSLILGERVQSGEYMDELKGWRTILRNTPGAAPIYENYMWIDDLYELDEYIENTISRQQ